MTTRAAHCLNCGQPIYEGRFGVNGRWEPDYNPGSDPVSWRHKNGYAACLGQRWATPRPDIVVLCGSTRFFDQFMEANYRLTLEGKIVLSVGFFVNSTEVHGEGVGVVDVAVKVQLDELHKRKIDVADEVFVINVGNYIGESTRSEIEYAIEHSKPVTYLEPVCIEDALMEQ